VIRLATGLAVAVFAFNSTSCKRASEESDAVEYLGGISVVQTVLKAQRIEAQRVRPNSPDGHSVSEQGKSFDLDSDLVTKTKAVLGTRQTYGGPSLCVFEPGIKLVFHTSNDAPVTFLLCLKCADILVEREEGKKIGFASFAPAMAEVEALAKQIFPNDDAIKDIIKNRETENRYWADKEAHWRDSMPTSIRPLWNDVLRAIRFMRTQSDLMQPWQKKFRMKRSAFSHF
jgi:hypothetical protein